MGLKGESSGTFPTGETAQEKGLSYVPNAYVIPAPHRPSLSPQIAVVPVIDMASLRSNDSVQRSLAIEELRKACISLGFFQVRFCKEPTYVYPTCSSSLFRIFISISSKLKSSFCSDNQSWNQ